MKIFVTGANGMVAKAVLKHCLGMGDSVTGLTRQELDITKANDVFAAVRADRPDAVINCAAYTDVDGSEANRELCYSVNATGVENLALASKDIGCAFATISTDYVFDGAKNDLYTQHDTPNPISYYGEAKLEGEILARNKYGRSIIVRSGWIFGNGGTNFLSTMHKHLEKGNPIKAIHDSFGTPTFAVDLAPQIRTLVELDLPLTYHVSNSGTAISFYDFAREICKLKNIDEDLVQKSSSIDLNRAAKRPGNSGLQCLFSERLALEPMPDWKAALERFLA